jgi:hypothetical protein
MRLRCERLAEVQGLENAAASEFGALVRLYLSCASDDDCTRISRGEQRRLRIRPHRRGIDWPKAQQGQGVAVTVVRRSQRPSFSEYPTSPVRGVP